MKLRDKVVLGKRTVDKNGFVSVPVAITKVGIQQYHVSELMDGANDKLRDALKDMSGMVNVFRPPETVFHPLTIESFKNIPITVQHPDNFVSPRDAKFVVSGHIGEDVDRMDDERLGATAHLHDKTAIDVSFGSETSAGYECPIIPSKGTYKGVNYDFAFDGAMIANHLALVPAGRCGGDVGVLDNNMENKEMNESEVKKLIDEQVGGLSETVGKAVGDAIAGLKLDELIATKVDEKFESAKKQADEEAKKKADEEAKKQADEKSKALEVDTRATLKTLLADKYDAEKGYMEQAREILKDSVEKIDERSDEYVLDKLNDLVLARKDADASLRVSRSDGAYTGINIRV